MSDEALPPQGRKPRKNRRYRSLIRANLPVIVRHIGYWIPGKDVFKRKEKIDRINKLVELIREELHNRKLENTAPRVQPSGPHTSYYQTIPFEFTWQSMPVQMTLDLHHEYFTISTAIGLPQHEADKTSSSFPVAKQLANSLHTFNTVLTERYKKIAAGEKPARVAEDQEKLAGPYDTFYIGAWEKFYDEILAGPVSRMGPDLGMRFADFNGLVVGNAKLNEAFMSRQPLPTQRAKPARQFTEDESVASAYTIIPFVSAGPESMAHDADKKEFAVCRILNGRGIYASALGTPPAQVQSLTYFLMTTNINPWQTARLINRLHTLGTVRLAAMHDMARLRRAGNDLHELEQDKLMAIGKLLPQMAGENDRDETIEKVTQRVFQASEDLRKIKEHIKGGLPYRVERSRYYQQQFNKLVPGLRIGPLGRIDGFQPYDEFVDRRFGSAYTFVNMLGTRYNRIERAITSINQQVRTAEITVQTGSIEKLQKETAEQTGRMANLQLGAELAFWPFLFPYYASTFWIEVADNLVKWDMLRKDWAEKAQLPIEAFVFSAGLTMTGYTILETEKGHKFRHVVEDKWNLTAYLMTKRAPEIIGELAEDHRKALVQSYWLIARHLTASIGFCYEDTQTAIGELVGNVRKNINKIRNNKPDSPKPR